MKTTTSEMQKYWMGLTTFNIVEKNIHELEDIVIATIQNKAQIESRI